MLNAHPSILTALLARAAERHAARTAVSAGDGEMTWSQLARRVSHLAARLQDAGVTRGDRVGLLVRHDGHGIAAIHAVLRAGAAYVPLDHAAPPDRLAVIVADAGIEVLIADPSRLDRAASVRAAGASIRLIVDVTAADGDEGLAPGPAAPVRTDDLAYILFTSGSSGMPKGVAHTHRSAMAFVRWAVDTFAPQAGDRLAAHAPWQFDLSVFDVFAAAATGAATCVMPEAVSRLPASGAAWLRRERPTFWYSVPFALVQLLERGPLRREDLESLRWVLFAGEAFPARHLRRLMALAPQARFANLYGPTETNVCTWYEVPAPPDAELPIGNACDHCELRLLQDEAYDVPLSAGATGELLVAGPSLLREYWRAPRQTTAAFWVSRGDGTRFYRTGDLVEVAADGRSLRLLGRRDRQIKTRGFRVELDEIELVLASHPAVTEAAAYAVPRDPSPLIEAVVVLAPAASIDPSDIRAYAAARLPPQAVPAVIRQADALPRTATGKTHRAVLAQARPTGMSEPER